MTMPTVCAGNIIITAQGSYSPHRGSLFSNGEVSRAMDLAAHKELVHLLFKSADTIHAAQHSAQLCWREFGYLFRHKILLKFLTLQAMTFEKGVLSVKALQET